MFLLNFVMVYIEGNIFVTGVPPEFGNYLMKLNESKIENTDNNVNSLADI